MWSIKTWKKVFENDTKKFKTGGVVDLRPGGMVPGTEKIPVWWEDMEVGEILKGKAVRLKSNENETGSKYLKNIVLKHGARGYKGIAYGLVDVYAVLDAFGVTCPAVAHAVKKLLCPGERGDKSKRQDITESKDAIIRAFEMEESRIDLAEALENAGDELGPHKS